MFFLKAFSLTLSGSRPVMSCLVWAIAPKWEAEAMANMIKKVKFLTILFARSVGFQVVLIV